MGQGRQASRVQALLGYADLALLVVQGLLLVPLYLREIGADLYGYWLASGGVLVWLTMLDFGLSRVLVQRVSGSYGRKNYQQTWDYLTGALVLYAAVAVTVVAVGIAGSPFLAGFLGADGSDAIAVSTAFSIAAVGLSFRLMNDCVRGFFTALLRPLVPMIALVLGRLVGLVAIFLLVRNGYGIPGIAIGNAVMALFPAMIHALYLPAVWRKMRPPVLRLDGLILREYFRLAPTLFGARLGRAFSKNIEPTIITVLIGPTSATMFSVTRRAGQLLSQGLHVLIGSSFPAYARVTGSASRQESSQAARKIFALLSHSTIIAMAGYMALNSSFVGLWVGEGTYAGDLVTLFIVFSLTMQIAQDLLSQFVIAESRVVIASTIEAIESVVRVALMLLLTQVTGVVGLPVAMTITTTFGSLLLGRQLYRSRPDLINRSLPSAELVGAVVAAAAIVLAYRSTNAAVDTWGGFLIAGVVMTGTLAAAAIVISRQLRATVGEVFTR